MKEFELNIEGENYTFSEPVSLWDLAKKYGMNQEYEPMLAFFNGKLKELNNPIETSGEISFVRGNSTIGNDTYRRSATLIMLKAFDDTIGGAYIDKIKVMYSISKGYYCEMDAPGVELTQELIDKVKARMLQIVDEDIIIDKQTINTDEAVKRFSAHGMFDKEKLFRYRRVSRANIYSINGYEDYYYGYMVPSTGFVKYFDIFLYGDGFVLQMPTKDEPTVVPKFKPQRKLFQVLKRSDDWSKKLEVETVGALNDTISNGHMNELILVQEALQEKHIAQIAETIANKNKKIILIAGPSSSGKTTFSHRLSIQLRAHGMKPHPIAVDDYFVEREATPKDEFGNFNFECIEALDLEQFNNDMLALLEGKKIEMPTFNFQTGSREYKGKYKQIGDGDVLVIEGIHGLNPKLTEKLSAASKYKIYISALTQLNIDEHNRIPTTDGRLIRRIVRDARTRGTSAEQTIAMWNSVRRGEEVNIFPFQEEADVMFNSALIYELSVIKQAAEPLLFSIPQSSPQFVEAKRLLKFLDYFLGIDGEMIPKNSLIREFIGGSCFNV